MTDDEYLKALIVRADAWLHAPGRNMLNETDDLVLCLTQAVRGFEQQEQRVIALTLKNEKLRSVLAEYVEWFGAVHGENCPADDTCSCIGGGLNARVNAVLKEKL
jgi:hypothetical protein